MWLECFHFFCFYSANSYFRMHAFAETTACCFQIVNPKYDIVLMHQAYDVPDALFLATDVTSRRCTALLA